MFASALLFASVLASVSLTASGKTYLVLKGYELKEKSRDTTPYTGDEVVGPIRYESNAYFSQRHYLDPCNGFVGRKYKMSSYSSSKQTGFIVINDCQMVICTKYRGSNTASTDTASLTSSERGGETTVYDLIESPSASTKRYAVLEDAAKCTCSLDVLNAANGEGSCYVGKFQLIESYDFSCVLRQIGEPGSIPCSSSGLSKSGTAGAVIGSLVAVMVVVAAAVAAFWLYKKKKNQSRHSESLESVKKKQQEDEAKIGQSKKGLFGFATRQKQVKESQKSDRPNNGKQGDKQQQKSDDEEEKQTNNNNTEAKTDFTEVTTSLGNNEDNQAVECTCCGVY